MSIRFKEISAGNFRELPVSGGYINVSNLIDIIKQKENIGEVNEIQLMNADTNEYLDKSQTLPAGSKVSYEITETGDENEEAMLKEIMGSGSAKDSNEYQKPVQQRRHVPMPMKMNDQSKHMPQKKPAPPAPTKMTEIADDLKCYICKNLLRNAVQVKCCQETFCEECINTYVHNNQKKSLCPKCGSKIDSKSMIPNKSLRQTIQQQYENNSAYQSQQQQPPPQQPQQPQYNSGNGGGMGGNHHHQQQQQQQQNNMNPYPDIGGDMSPPKMHMEEPKEQQNQSPIEDDMGSGDDGNNSDSGFKNMRPPDAPMAMMKPQPPYYVQGPQGPPMVKPPPPPSRPPGMNPYMNGMPGMPPMMGMPPYGMPGMYPQSYPGMGMPMNPYGFPGYPTNPWGYPNPMMQMPMQGQEEEEPMDEPEPKLEEEKPKKKKDKDKDKENKDKDKDKVKDKDREKDKKKNAKEKDRKTRRSSSSIRERERSKSRSRVKQRSRSRSRSRSKSKDRRRDKKRPGKAAHNKNISR